jgi:predicted dehydrogenase
MYTQKKYTVAQIGLGSRGIIHLEAFLSNRDRFDLAGICDRNPVHLQNAAARFKFGTDRLWSDAEKMMAELKPDILCFVTLPHIRLELVELAVKHGVSGLMFEKPIAVSIAEARRIYELCRDTGIKAIVCHQHKFLPSFLKLREHIDNGGLGKILRISAECQSWMAQIATHYTDYIIWANGGIGVESVVGHIHGRDRLTDNHPSPDFFMGEYVMRNGVRANIQCGYFTSPKLIHTEDYAANTFQAEFWTDNRLTVYGETGYAWAECNGRWAACTAKTGGRLMTGSFGTWAEERTGAQHYYTTAFADWLDDESKIHPSHVEQAYNGYEAVEGVCISALEKIRVDLPLKRTAYDTDSIRRMILELPDIPRRRLPSLKTEECHGIS